MSRKTFRNQSKLMETPLDAKQPSVPNRFNPQYFLAYLLYRCWQYFASERNPVLPLFFAFMAVVMSLYINLLMFDQLLKPWVDLHIFHDSWGLTLTKFQSKLWGLMLFTITGALIYPLFFLKNRYIAWFIAFDAESDRSRGRGTLLVFGYFLFSALLIVAALMSINYRRSHGG